MKTYNHFLIISLGWSLLCCDATVTVLLSTNANGDKSLECGSFGIISCLINPYANLMSWEINGTTYAMCTPACSENPAFPRNYAPTFDTTNGVFNLTIERAIFNDDNTTFKCDDGSSSDSITIEVVPAYSEHTTNTKPIQGGKQVEFTTTCVQLDVEFEWFTIKTDNSDKKSYNKGQKETTETAECSLPSNCSGVGTGKVSSVIMIETVQGYPGENRKEDRYIGVDVKYKNPDKNRTFRFDEIFQFEVPYCELHCGIIIFLIYLLRWFLLLALYFVGTYKCAFWKNSAIKGRLVAIGNIPIIGPCCSAFLLFHIIKDGKCWVYIAIIVCWIGDIGFLVAMIRECNGNTDEPCYMYAVYGGSASLPLPWFNFGGLAQYLKPETGARTYLCGCCSYLKTITFGNEPKALCGKCSKQTKKKEKNKCSCCCEFICEKCRNNHINDHEAKDKNCRCVDSWNKSELYCLRCKQYLCKWCKPIHAPQRIISHSQQETQIPCNLCVKDAKYYSSDDRKFVCEDCQTQSGLKDIIAIDDYFFHSENNVESYCLSCHQYVCTLCITKHDQHKIIRHSQQEAVDKRCQIFCNKCKKEATKKRGKYCKIGDKFFVCEDCKSKKDLKDIFAIDDMYFHSENNVESYCLSCQQYMCKICYSKHAEHKESLRQHEAGKKRCHIFCKFCLKIGKRTDAKYIYNNKGDRIFVCEDCKSGKDPNCVIAIDGLEQLDKDLKCKVGCKENPVECYCMIEDKNMCAACLKEIRTRSEVLKNWTETETEQVKLCALHSVAGLPSKKKAPLKQNAANESPADVLCLVCNEYLCKMCFKQHLDFKQLWRKQHHAEEFLDKQTSTLTILLLKPENVHVDIEEQNRVSKQKRI